MCAVWLVVWSRLSWWEANQCGWEHYQWGASNHCAGSRAYALGLNGLFINRAGREGQGIVAVGEVETLKHEIMSALEAWNDAETGDPVVRTVFDGLDIYPGGEDNAETPDLVIGYHSGYRASWQTTLGAVPAALIEPNAQKWSGDHCIDPHLVPGVLFTSFKPDREVLSIKDIWTLAEGRVH